jgi:hypothetical protein
MRTTVQDILDNAMPYEVATELAAAGWMRMTNATRKLYLRAREKHFSSELQKKDPAVKIEQKLLGKSLQWLLRQLRRLQLRRRRLQNQCASARRLPETSERSARIGAIELVVQVLDLWWEKVEDEIQRRKNLCKN